MSNTRGATVLEASRRRRLIADEAFRATLAGLSGVHVEVEPINADAEQDGLVSADVRADVESVLRGAGMGHTPSRLFADVRGTPVLHVDVMTVRLDGRCAYSLRLELWQGVRLTRQPSPSALALTWSAAQIVGTVPAADLCHEGCAAPAARASSVVRSAISRALGSTT